MILCKNVYNNFLGSLFFVTLNKMAYAVYLKMKYHKSGESIIIITNLNEACLIHNMVFNNPLMTLIIVYRGGKNAHEALGVVDLDVREEEISSND